MKTNLFRKSYFVKCLVCDDFGKVLWGDIIDVPLFARADDFEKVLTPTITGIYGEEAYYQILEIKRV